MPGPALSGYDAEELLALKTSCERCGAETTFGEASLYSKGPEHERWEVVCTPCSQGAYWVRLDEFLAGGGPTVDWLGQISEKTWMDGNDFMRCTKRLRTMTFTAIQAKK